jgi:hypothetical protein
MFLVSASVENISSFMKCVAIKKNLTFIFDALLLYIYIYFWESQWSVHFQCIYTYFEKRFAPSSRISLKPENYYRKCIL